MNYFFIPVIAALVVALLLAIARYRKLLVEHQDLEALYDGAIEEINELRIREFTHRGKANRRMKRLAGLIEGQRA